MFSIGLLSLAVAATAAGQDASLSAGGDWAAPKGMDDSIFPQRFEVDYVRVWPGKK